MKGVIFVILTLLLIFTYYFELIKIEDYKKSFDMCIKSGAVSLVMGSNMAVAAPMLVAPMLIHPIVNTCQSYLK